MIIKFDKDEHEAQALDNDDNKVGYCQYEEKNNTWVITHTVVDESHQGEGLAGKLLDEVCENARKENIKIIPVCPYAEKKFNSQAEKYRDLDAR